MTAEAAACRRLWVVVAGNAVVDAAQAVVRARDRDAEVRYQMRYFTGRNWREVCEMAGIQNDAGPIERFLRSGNVRATMNELYAVFGLADRKNQGVAA